MKSAMEYAVCTVRRCLEQSLYWQEYSLEQESYSRWAAREILLRLKKNRDTPPLIIIEEFRDQMDTYSCFNQLTSYVFSCAKDMAEWIIDLLTS